MLIDYSLYIFIFKAVLEKYLLALAVPRVQVLSIYYRCKVRFLVFETEIS